MVTVKKQDLGKRRTHCKWGHELTEDNVASYISKQNHLIRECKLCSKDKYNRRWKQLRDRHLQRKFGITIDVYEEMLKLQDGRCAICGTTEAKGNGQKNSRGSFHVDHNHSTGQIRKLLCMHCNSILGYSKESIEILKKAANYLEEHA